MFEIRRKIKLEGIALDTSTLNKQSTVQTYFHELTHWILYIMNENDLRNNEKVVDVFATFLHQARVSEQRDEHKQINLNQD